MTGLFASDQIDSIIDAQQSWKSEVLTLRSVLNFSVSIDNIEDVKREIPSKPADELKNTVRLTFPKNTRLHDSSNIIIARPSSKPVRAVYNNKSDWVDNGAIRVLDSEAIS